MLSKLNGADCLHLCGVSLPSLGLHGSRCIFDETPWFSEQNILWFCTRWFSPKCGFSIFFYCSKCLKLVRRVFSFISGHLTLSHWEQTDGFFWPIFVIATVAAVIASQAMISASFSCIKQSMSLGCFPRLKIVHTSRRLMGQIYIPVINWFLMIMCILVVATFRRTTDIANAYG